MNWKLCAVTLIVLATTSAARAQAHRGQQGHAVAPHHSGGMQPGHPQMPHGMSPEQHMWNQWYHEQMMMNELMGGSRGHRAHPQGSSGGSARSQAGQNQSGTNLQQSGRGRAGNHEAGRNGANHSEAAKKTANKPAQATKKPQSRNGKNASKTRGASDQSIISLLRTKRTRSSRGQIMTMAAIASMR